ncbi:MAG: hypothetical protein ACI80M_000130 [Gammaproteobacteria bacterium]|jgi:hypothetical protein
MDFLLCPIVRKTTSRCRRLHNLGLAGPAQKNAGDIHPHLIKLIMKSRLLLNKLSIPLNCGAGKLYRELIHHLNHAGNAFLNGYSIGATRIGFTAS